MRLVLRKYRRRGAFGPGLVTGGLAPGRISKDGAVRMGRRAHMLDRPLDPAKLAARRRHGGAMPDRQQLPASAGAVWPARSEISLYAPGRWAAMSRLFLRRPLSNEPARPNSHGVAPRRLWSSRPFLLDSIGGRPYAVAAVAACISTDSYLIRGVLASAGAEQRQQRMAAASGGLILRE
jgi:hypothetical protein